LRRITADRFALVSYTKIELDVIVRLLETTRATISRFKRQDHRLLSQLKMSANRVCLAPHVWIVKSLVVTVMARKASNVDKEVGSSDRSGNRSNGIFRGLAGTVAS
jgi:hypothetical protein